MHVLIALISNKELVKSTKPIYMYHWTPQFIRSTKINLPLVSGVTVESI